MRIGFVFYSLSKRVGGIQRAGTRLVNAMQQRGHKCVVFIDDHKKRTPVFALNPKVEVQYIDLLDNSWSRRKVRNKILRAELDFIMPMSSSGVLKDWPAILKGTGVPLVVSERTDPQFANNFFSTDAERYAILSTAARILVQTEKGCSAYPDFLKDRVFAIPNSVDLPTEFVQDFSNSCICKKRIIHVGRIHDAPKQQRLLVRAFSLLAKDFDDWELHFWGDGTAEETKALKAEIQSQDLEGRAFMNGETGTVSDKLLESQVFAFPSRFEGFPNALLEAQAHGLPAIGWNECGGTNEIIIDGVNGLLFDDLTPESVAEKLKVLLQDDLLRKRMGQAARENVKQYEPCRIYDRFDAFFRQVPNVTIEAASEGIQDIEIKNNLDRLLSSEYVHKSNYYHSKSLLFSVFEDARKRFSRAWIRPIRDCLRQLKGKFLVLKI